MRDVSFPGLGRRELILQKQDQVCDEIQTSAELSCVYDYWAKLIPEYLEILLGAFRGIVPDAHWWKYSPVK